LPGKEAAKGVGGLQDGAVAGNVGLALKPNNNNSSNNTTTTNNNELALTGKEKRTAPMMDFVSVI
jgi:hypothetical protein